MAARNRPRSSFAKEEMADELNLWNSIVDKIKRCHAIRQKYDAVEARKQTIEEEMKADSMSPKESLAKLDELEKLYREGLRYSEEELKVLNEEPDDLLRNLDTLVSVRSAFEIDVPRPTLNTKARNGKRKLDVDGASDSPIATPDTATPSTAAPRVLSKAVSRSGSVAAASVKSENSGEANEPIKPVALGKESKLVVGVQVLHRKKGSDGVGILCQVTKVIGDGKQRRYEVQDVDSSGDTPVEKVTIQNLIPVPDAEESLPEISKGTQVVAVYPDTTTFYKAQVVGLKKDGSKYRLRFEGEEEKNKEQEVSRYLVLDVK